MTRKSLILLNMQKFIGRMAIFILAPLYFFAAKMLFYRVRDLKKNKKFMRRRICKAQRGMDYLFQSSDHDRFFYLKLRNVQLASAHHPL